MSCADTPLDFSSTDADWLDRGPAVDALQQLLDSDGLQTPLTVGVYGGWGTGKTSVMLTLKERLGESPDRLMLWFDAWVYARQEEALWRALLLCVVEALRRRTLPPDGEKLQGEAYDKARTAFDQLWLSEKDAEKARHELDEARTSLYRSLAVKERGGVRVNWWGALPLAADVALTALTAGLNKQVAEAIAGEDAKSGITTALAKWFKGKDTQDAVKLIERESSERYVEEVSSLEQFQETFRTLLTRFGIGKGQKERRLYIFVDDLDRCLPEDAVAALEAIKLFLDLPGCVFVLGMDRQVVEQGIRVRYEKLMEAGFDARAYLDKVIQVPFNLPPLGEHQIRLYLQRLSTAVGHGAFQACRDLILAASPPNPRTLKRVLNALLLTLYLDGGGDEALQQLGQGGGDRERLRRLAKLVLLQVCFEAFWQAVVQGTCTLKDAEKVAAGQDISLPKEIAESLKTGRLRELLTIEPKFGTLIDEEMTGLLTLSKITSTA